MDHSCNFRKSGMDLCYSIVHQAKVARQQQTIHLMEYYSYQHQGYILLLHKALIATFLYRLYLFPK